MSKFTRIVLVGLVAIFFVYSLDVKNSNAATSDTCRCYTLDPAKLNMATIKYSEITTSSEEKCKTACANTKAYPPIVMYIYGDAPDTTALNMKSVLDPVVSTIDSKKMNYTLLESFPGFFKAKSEMTDLPTMIISIYKFGIWTVGIAGLFMLVVGGFMYMTSAGNTSSAGNARGIITDALLGIVAALGAYIILYVINPDLTKISLNFTAVEVSELKKGAEIEAPAENAVSAPVTTDIVYSNGYPIPRSFDRALKEIATAGIKNKVESGIRTAAKQAELVALYCKGNPPSCSPAVCLSPTRCPHTAGVAIDVWALNGSGGQAIGMDQCKSNVHACFNNPYQKALVAAMKGKGFCVLATEPWHFEKPKMSSSCS